MYESQAKDQLVHPKTDNIAPYSRSEDGSIARMKTAREIRPEIPVIMSTADETQEDEVDQANGQGSIEIDTLSVRTPEVDMLSSGLSQAYSNWIVSTHPILAVCH